VSVSCCYLLSSHATAEGNDCQLHQSQCQHCDISHWRRSEWHQYDQRSVKLFFHPALILPQLVLLCLSKYTVFMLLYRPGSLITSRPSCVNFTGFPFVSVLSTNCRWRSTSACMDWRLRTWLLTVSLWRLCQADDISDLLSPAASLSPGQWPIWAVGTLQSLEPKYGTVYLSAYDSSLGHCVHSDIN